MPATMERRVTFDQFGERWRLSGDPERTAAGALSALEDWQSFGLSY
jgi:hypothetical protein